MTSGRCRRVCVTSATVAAASAATSKRSYAVAPEEEISYLNPLSCSPLQ